jgi:hypothetical protein
MCREKNTLYTSAPRGKGFIAPIVPAEIGIKKLASCQQHDGMTIRSNKKGKSNYYQTLTPSYGKRLKKISNLYNMAWRMP